MDTYTVVYTPGPRMPLGAADVPADTAAAAAAQYAQARPTHCLVMVLDADGNVAWTCPTDQGERS